MLMWVDTPVFALLLCVHGQCLLSSLAHYFSQLTLPIHSKPIFCIMSDTYVSSTITPL